MAKVMAAGMAGLTLALGAALPLPTAAQTRSPTAGTQAPSPARAASCVRDYRRALLSEKGATLIADFDRMGYQAKYQQIVLRHGLMSPAYGGTGSGYGFVTAEFEEKLEATARGNGLMFSEFLTSMNTFPVHTDLDSGNPQHEARAIEALAECDRQFGFPTVTRAAPPPDFECAVRYVVGGQLVPQDRAGAMERANQSAAAHLQTNPGDTPAAIGERIKTEATRRLKPFEALMAEGNHISETWRDAEIYADVAERRARLERKRQEWQARQAAAGQPIAAGIAACEAKYGRTRPPERPRAQGQ
ncbi:MAG: hypothetical protein EDM03_14430 [Porphyrobacter sp. IPPAS B-1204]|nr:MAG: hypothetical protein EDM03_14430 [Porphyrobacter sp. IPPAS B-1204]